MMPARDQRIEFGVVTGTAAPRHIIGDDPHIANFARDIVARGRDDGDDGALLQTKMRDILCVHEHDVACTVASPSHADHAPQAPIYVQGLALV